MGGNYGGRRSELSAEQLRTIVSYDPDTGLMVSLVNSRQRKIGGQIGSDDCTKGYLQARIKGVMYKVHILAFLYMTGRYPADQIDHINGDKKDNRWVNFRECSNAENCRNRPLRKDSQHGLKGVGYHRKSARYTARIQVDGKRKTLGYFRTKEEAHQAYCDAAKNVHAKFARFK